MSDSESAVMLAEITELSHEFGTDEYLKGGGGNSSVKSDTTLWVKPSGTVLSTIKPGDFLPMVREEMQKAYDMKPPEDAAARETMIKDAMAAAVQPGFQGRASVEAPLHESIDAKYVMHTHPVFVNGMTCSKNGATVCQDLFPDHLWVDYIDPGYTLCMQLRNEIAAYKQQSGRQPEAIFLKNHGLFVGADTPERLRELHDEIMSTMKEQYEKAAVTAAPVKKRSVSDEEFEEDVKAIKQLLNGEAAYICCSDVFDIASGPITPDHIVYHKAFPYTAELRPEGIIDFKKRRGYSPKIIKTTRGVYAVAADQRGAELAFELAFDGAQIMNLAEAFGGIEYMSDAAAYFIDNWEVEAYRRKQVS